MFRLRGSNCKRNYCSLQYLPLRSMLNTVCGSYLMHAASEGMLAAHRAETWARWNKPCRSYRAHLARCQTSDGLIDAALWKIIHIFLDWSGKSGDSFIPIFTMLAWCLLGQKQSSAPGDRFDCRLFIYLFIFKPFPPTKRGVQVGFADRAAYYATRDSEWLLCKLFKKSLQGGFRHLQADKKKKMCGCVSCVPCKILFFARNTVHNLTPVRNKT